MFRTYRWAVLSSVCFLLGSLVAAGPVWSAEAKYAIKPVKADPPMDLKEPIRKLLSDQSIQLLDPKGTALYQVWMRKEVPAEVTAAQIKNGLTYRDLKETTLLGAVQLFKQGSDYRKQKVKAGVYTLRLAFQPMDGDHMGVSAHQEFCLLVSAGNDTKADVMKPKALQDLSTKSISTAHPGCFMLFPYDKPAAEPKLVSKGNDHWVLHVRGGVAAGKLKGTIGIGLNLIGYAD